jgi:hypothetical protein
MASDLAALDARLAQLLAQALVNEVRAELREEEDTTTDDNAHLGRAGAVTNTETANGDDVTEPTTA